MIEHFTQESFGAFMRWVSKEFFRRGFLDNLSFIHKNNAVGGGAGVRGTWFAGTRDALPRFCRIIAAHGRRVGDRVVDDARSGGSAGR